MKESSLFSLALSQKFGTASHLWASSLDSYETVIQKFKAAKSNLDTLKKLGASLIHGVDATEMKRHPELRERSLDRFIFNFPMLAFMERKTTINLFRINNSCF